MIPLLCLVRPPGLQPPESSSWLLKLDVMFAFLPAVRNLGQSYGLSQLCLLVKLASSLWTFRCISPGLCVSSLLKCVFVPADSAAGLRALRVWSHEVMLLVGAKRSVNLVLPGCLTAK